MRRIVLASASPRRKELLRQIGIEFSVVAADVDETPLPDEAADAYTMRLALAKAKAVLSLEPDALVLGADTVVTIDGLLLGKPTGAQSAREMLLTLQNRKHDVLTGVAVISQTVCYQAVEKTAVFFETMTDEEISAYVAGGEPVDKAGAYAIQGHAARWISRIEGDYANVVGLPLSHVYKILREVGAV